MPWIAEMQATLGARVKTCENPVDK